MSFNKVIIMGNLTRDPELAAIPSGLQVCKFTLAINHRTKDKEEVCFVDVTAWGKQAEFVGNYFKKGSSILVDGRLRQETWMKEGKQNSKHTIVAESVSFVGKNERTDEKNASEEKKYFGSEDVSF